MAREKTQFLLVKKDYSGLGDYTTDLSMTYEPLSIYPTFDQASKAAESAIAQFGREVAADGLYSGTYGHVSDGTGAKVTIVKDADELVVFALCVHELPVAPKHLYLSQAGRKLDNANGAKPRHDSSHEPSSSDTQPDGALTDDGANHSPPKQLTIIITHETGKNEGDARNGDMSGDEEEGDAVVSQQGPASAPPNMSTLPNVDGANEYNHEEMEHYARGHARSLSD